MAPSRGEKGVAPFSPGKGHVTPESRASVPADGGTAGGSRSTLGNRLPLTSALHFPRRRAVFFIFHDSRFYVGRRANAASCSAAPSRAVQISEALARHSVLITKRSSLGRLYSIIAPRARVNTAALCSGDHQHGSSLQTSSDLFLSDAPPCGCFLR